MKRDLEQLVAFKTENPPGRETEAAAFVGHLLSAEGLVVRLDEYKPSRTNVVARLDNGGGPVFAFNTHLDVVPAGDGWTGEPFRLREIDNKLYGRGACDAKGPLIAMIEAMRLLNADRKLWRGTLLGVFVADEEVASEGAKHYTASRPRIDFAVVGEPTSNDVVIAHKGSLRPRIEVHGVSAHSGTPELGENAIYSAARLITKVERHHSMVCQRTHPLVGGASITVTRAHAGVAANVIPDRCELLIDRRMVPGESEELVKGELIQLLESANKEENVRAEILEFTPTTGGPTETPIDHPIVGASTEASRRHGSRAKTPQGFQGGCDLVHFRNIGAAGVVVGPGSLAVAHKPDEFVPVHEFVAASMIYRDIVLEMLKAT